MSNIKARSNKQFEKIENKIDNFASEAVSAVKNEIDPNSATLAGAISASAVDSVREYLNSNAETLNDALESVITEIAEQVVPSGSGEENGSSGSLSGNLKDLIYGKELVNSGYKPSFDTLSIINSNMTTISSSNIMTEDEIILYREPGQLIVTWTNNSSEGEVYIYWDFPDMDSEIITKYANMISGRNNEFSWAKADLPISGGAPTNIVQPLTEDLLPNINIKDECVNPSYKSIFSLLYEPTYEEKNITLEDKLNLFKKWPYGIKDGKYTLNNNVDMDYLATELSDDVEIYNDNTTFINISWWNNGENIVIYVNSTKGNYTIQNYTNNNITAGTWYEEITMQSPNGGAPITDYMSLNADSLPQLDIDEKSISQEYKSVFFKIISKEEGEIISIEDKFNEMQSTNTSDLYNCMYKSVELIDGSDYQLSNNYSNEFFTKYSELFTSGAGTLIYLNNNTEIDLVKWSPSANMNIDFILFSKSEEYIAYTISAGVSGWFSADWNSNDDCWELVTPPTKINNVPILESLSLSSIENENVLKDILGLSLSQKFDQYISLTELKSIVADSSDFADFQNKIANL